MRLVAIVSTLLLLAGAQDTPEPRKASKPPEKNDAVIVKGCVKGPVFESDETRKADDTGSLEKAISYRMSGDKDLLEELRDEHANHTEQITGVLKSELPDENLGRGRQLGKTGIYIGGGLPRSGIGGIQSMTPYLPVLEVKSTEHLSNHCF